MEDSTINKLKLPPSKRFKYLHPNDHQPTAAAAATCLPAKKRIWAPPPLSPLKPQLDLNQRPPTPSPPQLNPDSDDSDDDGIICAVCRLTDADPSNPIVFCDGPDCNLTVHAACYGNPLIQSIPDGDWFCSKCAVKSETEISCCLCKKPGGAIKPTVDDRWAHIVCAMYVPEVFFRDSHGRDGVDCSKVPSERSLDVECYLCGCASGCKIECAEQKCELGFHASCGVDEGLCLEYVEGRKGGGGVVAGFCGAHSQLWKKQQLTGKFKIVAGDKSLKRKSRN